MEENITRLTVKRLLPLLIALLLSMIIVIGWNFRSLVMASMQEHIHSIAQITKAGLTAHMKANQMENRAYFLQEITTTPHIKSIKIIRSDAVTQQFGNAMSGEMTPNPILSSILMTKKPYYEMNEWGAKATLRAVVPYIATSQGNLNCLTCHNVPENTVLGAVDIELDVTEYRNWAWTYLLILFLIVLFFAGIILFTTSRVIEQHVRRPLLDLIHLAKAIFYRTHTAEYNSFKSLEFVEVARQFQKIDKELIERDNRIEQATKQFDSLSSQIDDTLKQTLFAMGEAEERRSNETRYHTRRVVEYSRLLGMLAGLDNKEIELLAVAAPLHDIGKIGIPDSILLKPGKLDPEERAIMDMHSTMGYEILKHSEQAVLLAAATIAHQHHERWDGMGYPRKLKGEDIHIFGRIVAITDVLDALMTKRVYKEPWSQHDIKQYFSEERGKAFDPNLTDLLLQNFPRFEGLMQDISHI